MAGKKEKTVHADKDADKDAEAGNVEKIRDILFGNQMRDYDRKFSRLEERIMKEVARLSEESSKRLDALEGYISREVESLDGRIKVGQHARSDLAKEFADKLCKGTKVLEKRQTELDNQLITTTRDLRQQILDQSKMLSDEIANRYAETSNSLNHTVGELREDKVDRSALSALLTELALQLSDKSTLVLDEKNRNSI